MKQIKIFGDERELCFCAYCGRDTRTRDHVPSRVLLDEPYPENLPVVPACEKCNEGFSLHEEYLACLIECVLAGAALPDAVKRPKIQRILSKKPTLVARIQEARIVVEGQTSFAIEHDRAVEVMKKLACGHSLFDLHIRQSLAEAAISLWPIPTFRKDEWQAFNSLPPPRLLPEVGSRVLIEQVQRGSFHPEWVQVQPGRYRYSEA